jgi:hypothetical protein
MSLIATLQAAQATVPSLDQCMHQGWAWLYTHWAVVLAVTAWMAANVAPRPHPEALVGWRKIFWTLIDRVCVLSAASLPGVFKFPGASSPPLVVPANRDDSK